MVADTIGSERLREDRPLGTAYAADSPHASPVVNTVGETGPPQATRQPNVSSEALPTTSIGVFADQFTLAELIMRSAALQAA